jgi:hypothetical protein
MSGVLRPAAAGSRGAAARLGLAALLACLGVSWTAGVSSAFATYGTVKITKVNEGGDQADRFHFDAPSAMAAGGVDLKGGETYVNTRVHANAGSYGYLGDYLVSEPASDAYELKSVDCTVDGGYGRPAAYGSATRSGNGVKLRVGVDHTVACTFTNVRKARIVVSKTTARADAAAPRTAFAFTESPNAAAFDLADGGSDTRTVAPGKAYTIAEADARALGYELTAIACSTGTSDVATRSATVAPGPGETVTCAFTDTKLEPAIAVVTRGPATAYSGDTLPLRFDVTNPGERPLHDVRVADDRCAPVAGPATKTGGDQDDVLDPGETWQYACSYVATNVLNADPNPVTNVATVRAADDEGTTVEARDAHDTLFFHPAVDLEESGPATATAGAPLIYALDVSNIGDMPFAKADVTVADARCATAPALRTANGDATPDVLDPGDRWTWTCQVQTAAGQTAVVDRAGVTATDENGRIATDDATFTTALTQPAPASTAPSPAPAQEVAGIAQASRPARGTAAVRGPHACPTTRRVTVAVSGRQIRRVTFLVDGRRVRTVAKAGHDGRFTLTLRTASLRRGTTGVAARVEFTAASQTPTRTLRLTITRCARVVQPRFAG